MKYIDADILRKDIEFAKSIYNNPQRVVHGVADSFRQDGRAAMCDDILKKIDSLQQEQPEPYFYCKYGGTMPLCSDCKRNHNNSSFKTEEITTWYTPSNGTKHCIDYIQQEQPEMDLEKEIANMEFMGVNDARDIRRVARHFYELGKKQ